MNKDMVWVKLEEGICKRWGWKTGMLLSLLWRWVCTRKIRKVRSCFGWPVFCGSKIVDYMIAYQSVNFVSRGLFSPVLLMSLW